MLVSAGLPTHRVDAPEEFLVGEAISEIAVAAERAGFGAVWVTDHPFPDDGWMARGGHHAVDPFVALSFAAAATSTLRLHTNLLVVAYRNPLLVAHQVATLDRMSGGRVILGVGAGYLEPEFEVLGSDFATRNERTDAAISTMRAAWSGKSVDVHTMAPTPVQPGGPPIWVGGNSRRAIRRAVELGDAWMPFPSGGGMAKATRTTPLRTPHDLRSALLYVEEHAEAVGRTAPLDVVFSPVGGAMHDRNGSWDSEAVLDDIAAFRDAGMTAMSVLVPGTDRAALIEGLQRFGEEVLSELA